MPETLSLHGEKPNRKVKRNLDMLRTGAGGHCVHLAAVALGRVGAITQFGQPSIPRSWVAVVAATAISCHLHSQNHQGGRELVPPSGMFKSIR